LTRQIEQLKDERPGIAARLANARMLLEDLTEQTRVFAEARILQLEARQDELRAEVAAAQAAPARPGSPAPFATALS
jgi:hypothetical protein